MFEKISSKVRSWLKYLQIQSADWNGGWRLLREKRGQVRPRKSVAMRRLTARPRKAPPGVEISRFPITPNIVGAFQ